MATPKLIAKIESDDTVNHKLAVLIDADNAQAKIIGEILAEVAKYGEAIVKRIYGDFTSPTSSSWKRVLQAHAIKPVQQFAYTTGKNATDSTMIIDAMDLLYTGRFDGFCLVTSDSDFTGLAMRLREEGLQVYGFGRERTPDAFVKACNRFISVEIFKEIAAEHDVKNTHILRKEVDESSFSSMQASSPVERTLPLAVIKQAVEAAASDDGWADIGKFGSIINKLLPDFDSRLYGHKRLSDLVKVRQDVFETVERQVEASGQIHRRLYLKART